MGVEAPIRVHMDNDINGGTLSTCYSLLLGVSSSQ